MATEFCPEIPAQRALGYSPVPMNPLDALHRLLAHVTDRARARSFYRFLVRRFLDDNLLQAAGALSFTTVFAVVPLSVVVFGVL